MSLNWEVKDIEDFETRCFVKNEDGTSQLNPVTNVMIFATMSMGIGDLNKKNALEFIKRMRIYQGVFGAFMRKGDEPYYLAAEHIVQHIGLKTNVGHESRSKFMKRIWDSLDREVRYEEKEVEAKP